MPLTEIRFPKQERDNKQQDLLFQRNAILSMLYGDDRRASYRAMASQCAIPDGALLEHVSDNGIKGWWISPKEILDAQVIMFVHGGGYHLGDATSYLGFVSELALRFRRRIFSVDYNLAPEKVFPAAYDDVFRTARWLLDNVNANLSLMGDSAGGGLVLSVLNELTAIERIANVVVFSPWTDLTMSGASFNDSTTVDQVFTPSILRSLALSYLDGANPRDSRASPMFGVRKLLPPILIQVGSNELLLDDSRRFADAAAEQGGAVTLEIYDGMHHVFQRDIVVLDIARTAIESVATFLGE